MGELTRLKKANRRAITEYLRQYDFLKKQYAEKEAEIAESGIVMRARLTPRSKKITKPTEDKAIRLSEMRGRDKLKEIIDAIEFVKTHSYGVKGKVLQVYYFEGKPPETVCDEAHIGRTCMYKHAKEIVEDVAELLGYIVD
jgi:RinA family phage transcriptional activator